jgi:uncharacterized protein (TIGR03435 family)
VDRPCSLALAFCVLAAVLSAQPAFEAATIRPVPEGTFERSGTGGLRNGTFTAQNQRLITLVATAYGVSLPLVFGPDWMDKANFDVVAKAPAGASPKDLQPMLLALLRERFQMAAHREMREMQVYHLVVGKGGPKMAVYPAPERSNDASSSGRGYPMIRASAITTGELAAAISGLVGRTVVDKTGLTERYNIALKFAPVGTQSSTPDTDGGPPDLVTAVQEQLGLKLEGTKDNVEVVVVDYIQRTPSEN